MPKAPHSHSHSRTDRQTNHFAHPSSSIYRVPNDLKTILMSFKSGSDPSKLGMMLLCYLFFQSRHPLSAPRANGGKEVLRKRAWSMSIPSIHAEKVADIRFRNHRRRGREEGRFFICIFVPLPASAKDRQTERGLFRLGESACACAGVGRDVW